MPSSESLYPPSLKLQTLVNLPDESAVFRVCDSDLLLTSNGEPSFEKLTEVVQSMNQDTPHTQCDMVYVDKEGENILICADADLQEALFEHRDDTVPLTLKLLPRKSKKVALQCEVHVYMDGEDTSHLVSPETFLEGGSPSFQLFDGAASKVFQLQRGALEFHFLLSDNDKLVIGSNAELSFAMEKHIGSALCICCRRKIPISLQVEISSEGDDKQFVTIKASRVLDEEGKVSFSTFRMIVSPLLSTLDCLVTFMYRVDDYLSVIACDEDLEHALDMFRGGKLIIHTKLQKSISVLEIPSSIIYESTIRLGNHEGKAVVGYWNSPDDYVVWRLAGFRAGQYRAYTRLASKNKAALLVGVCSSFNSCKPTDHVKHFRSVDTRDSGSYSNYYECPLGNFSVSGKFGECFYVIPKRDGWAPTNLMSLTLEFIGA